MAGSKVCGEAALTVDGDVRDVSLARGGEVILATRDLGVPGTCFPLEPGAGPDIKETAGVRTLRVEAATDGAGRLAPPEAEGGATLFCLTTTDRVLVAFEALSAVDICVLGNADGGTEIRLLPPTVGNAALPFTPGVEGAVVIRGESPLVVLFPTGTLERLLGTIVVTPLASLVKLALEYARAFPAGPGVLKVSLSTEDREERVGASEGARRSIENV